MSVSLHPPVLRAPDSNGSAPDMTAHAAQASDELSNLVRAMASGDEQALARLYDISCARVYGMTLKILRDAGTAEEVTHDAYLQAWRNARDFDMARGNPLAWLLMIARTRALDRLRRDKRHQLDEPLTEATPGLPDDASHDEDHLRSRRVRLALATLAPEQQRVLLLAYYRGMSHSEIATELCLPLGTVKTQIRTGVLRLRDALKDAQIW